MPTIKALAAGFFAFAGVQFILGLFLIVLINFHILPQPIVKFLEIPYMIVFIELAIFILIVTWSSKQESRKNLQNLKKDIRRITKK